MLTAFSQRELVERAREAGAMAYLVKPFSKADLLPAVEMAMSRYDELVTLEREVVDLRDRLETRKLVDRAKGLLQAALRAGRGGGLPVGPADLHGPADDHAPGGRAGDRRRRQLTAFEGRVRAPAGVTVVAVSDAFRSRLGNDVAPIGDAPARQSAEVR